jgi:hypothetical protein
MTENPYASSWFVNTATILLFITGLMIPRLRDWFGRNNDDDIKEAEAEYHSEEEIHYNSEESENEVNQDDMVEEDDWDSAKKQSQEGHIE